MPRKKGRAQRLFDPMIMDKTARIIIVVVIWLGCLAGAGACLKPYISARSTLAGYHLLDSFETDQKAGPDHALLLQAGGVLIQAVKQDPNNASAWLGLGRVYQNLGRDESAAQAYRNAAREIKSFIVFGEIGACLARSKRFDEAIRYYLKALALCPDYDLAKDNLAWLTAGEPSGQPGSRLRYDRKGWN
ncbi:MAG: tetratricopeptide repeat protein [Deltaproteobacteria bacterium]|nr:tetratricopeptide repeat protein [Deltaproteobacteria bacterium]